MFSSIFNSFKIYFYIGTGINIHLSSQCWLSIVQMRFRNTHTHTKCLKSNNSWENKVTFLVPSAAVSAFILDCENKINKEIKTGLLVQQFDQFLFWCVQIQNSQIQSKKHIKHDKKQYKSTNRTPNNKSACFTWKMENQLCSWNISHWPDLTQVQQNLQVFNRQPYQKVQNSRFLFYGWFY